LNEDINPLKMEKWRLNDIGSQSGKSVVITGANSGLGYESAKILSRAGAKVVMACRSLSKGEKARESILQHNPGADLVIMELDLTSLQSIRNFAGHYKEQNQKLHILINNAGIMMTPFHLTEDGFEQQMATNHLGHFALTALLMEVIKKSSGARVVQVSSMAHKVAKLSLDEIHSPQPESFSPFRTYANSKLANLLFTFELQRYFEKHKIDAMALAAHPGFAFTNIIRYLGSPSSVKFLKSAFAWLIPTAQQGALPLIRASVDENARGADYFGPSNWGGFRGKPVRTKASSKAFDEVLARQLWELSEKLTRCYFD
jgi:NAD(P)-dependent dehydrogenase (short-subunit alcohol dehydrogenase family)